MITDYFTHKKVKPIITQYYELHRSFIERKQFNNLFNEIYLHLAINSSRKSCVCLDNKFKQQFTIYNLPLIDWTVTASHIRNKILTDYNNLYSIDYGLIHYYENCNSNITWHSDREALRSNIYSISVGGTRRFCLRNRETKEVLTFDLFDGDLFVMKIGCQDKYEHCIKSIKLFNEPRISITFRQLETPILYYTYYPLEMKIITTEICPDVKCYKVITETREKIIIGIVDNNPNNFMNIHPKNINISLIKSNLQKSVRRKLENIALQSTMEMIISGHSIDLLRRLTIISFEDVCINKYYCVIVWYYIALSKNYNLTDYDVSFICSYVKLLCDIDMFYENIDNINNNHISKEYKQNELLNNVNCIALYLRLQFGGFTGEKIFINNLIDKLLIGEINVCETELSLCKYQIYENELDILSCAIDFHCFPKIVVNVLSKLQNEKNSVELNEKDIRQYIWTYDSNINCRIKNAFTNLDHNIWTYIIKPKCDIYRYHIMKMLNIKKLIE